MRIPASMGRSREEVAKDGGIELVREVEGLREKQGDKGGFGLRTLGAVR